MTVLKLGWISMHVGYSQRGRETKTAARSYKETKKHFTRMRFRATSDATVELILDRVLDATRTSPYAKPKA